MTMTIEACRRARRAHVDLHDVAGIEADVREVLRGPRVPFMPG